MFFVCRNFSTETLWIYKLHFSTRRSAIWFSSMSITHCWTNCNVQLTVLRKTWSGNTSGRYSVPLNSAMTTTWEKCFCWKLCTVFCVPSIDSRIISIQGRQSVFNIVRVQSPSPSLPSFPLPSPPLPLIQRGGLGESCKVPQWGLGRSPSRQRFWCIFRVKERCWWHSRCTVWNIKNGLSLR